MKSSELLEIARKIRNELDRVREVRKLSFVEEGHKYSIYDPIKQQMTSDLPSVSTLITKYSIPFDADAKSLQKANGDVELANEIKASWAKKGEDASSTGSYAHFKLEQYVWSLFDIDKEVRKPFYELSDDDLLEAQIMVKNGINLTHSIIENGFVPLETECVMGSTELGYFGQCDNLWLGYYRDRLVILTSDYKTNLSKNFKVRPWNVPMFTPFEKLMDTTLSEYYIQQPLYAQLLTDMLKESEFGEIPIIGFRILHLRDEGKSIKIPTWVYNEVRKLYPVTK